MKVYILHECIDSSDFYAEGNIITINKDKEKLSERCSCFIRIAGIRKEIV